MYSGYLAVAFKKIPGEINTTNIYFSELYDRTEIKVLLFIRTIMQIVLIAVPVVHKTKLLYAGQKSLA